MRRSTVVVFGLGVLAAALAAGGFVANRAVVQAAGVQTNVTGIISTQLDGQVVIYDGSTIYYLVSAIDLSPFQGPTVVVCGGLDQGTLYVSELTLGVIHVVDQQGMVTVDAAGTVEQTDGGFGLNAEGIVFNLYGASLEQFVGQTADAQGDLTGTDLTVTDITPGG
jgi:hypothetical protein